MCFRLTFANVLLTERSPVFILFYISSIITCMCCDSLRYFFNIKSNFCIMWLNIELWSHWVKVHSNWKRRPILLTICQTGLALSHTHSQHLCWALFEMLEGKTLLLLLKRHFTTEINYVLWFTVALKPKWALLNFCSAICCLNVIRGIRYLESHPLQINCHTLKCTHLSNPLTILCYSQISKSRTKFSF